MPSLSSPFAPFRGILLTVAIVASNSTSGGITHQQPHRNSCSTYAILTVIHDNSHLPLQEEQQQNQQLLQQLLEDQERRFEQLLQKQELCLKEAFSSQIAALVATINTLVQVSNKLLL